MSDQTTPNGSQDHLESSKAHARAAAAEMRDAAAEAAHELRERAEDVAGEWQEKGRGNHSRRVWMALSVPRRWLSARQGNRWVERMGVVGGRNGGRASWQRRAARARLEIETRNRALPNDHWGA